MAGSLDVSVGRIVCVLERPGQLDDTLIVFFLSDNGCPAYIGNVCPNAPHAGFKRYHQGGVIRVPFIGSWPSVLPSGRIYE